MLKLIKELSNFSNRIAIRPKVHDCGGDPSKRWFVYFSYRHPETGKMKRFKRYEGFDSVQTLEGKLTNAKRLIAEINRHLDNGWSPFQEKDKFVYENILSYSTDPDSSKIKSTNFSIEYFLNLALAERKKRIRVTSFEAYQSQIRIFLKWIRENKLSTQDIGMLTPKVIESFLDSLVEGGKKSNTTRNNYRTNLKGIFNILLKRKHISENPFNEIEPLPETKQSKKAFNKIQMNLLREEIRRNNPQLWLFVQMMYYTYIRPRELRFLKIMDIELSEKKILIRADISKNKKRLYVAIPNQLQEELRNIGLDKLDQDWYLFGNSGVPGKHHCSKNHFYNIHNDILKGNGFSNDYSLYSWKHTGVKEAVLKGVNLKTIQLQLRHHSLDETNEYLKSLGVTDCEELIYNFPEI